ncbi:putative quinol monooxygenase [Sphingomonas sp. H39-1-10]|uniref:putative quinol monooxygenase n=1 Tax=Sphingomonas TaxID=13687 RepID=UPI00087EFEF3|nr:MULTISPECIES: putative quinol monooxygenase [Sphingomonas]MDF0487523.1 putative quinol monooxygenase [Sphingomonas pollutisoli]SDA16459.1 Quinol monooxygenase YgiN [Sphingomonas sp. NFR15]
MIRNVKTVGVLTARLGKEADLQALLEGLIEPSRAEPGNLRYDLWADPAEPGVFVLDELYVDAGARDAHRATPHYQRYLATIAQLAERKAFSLEPLIVA